MSFNNNIIKKYQINKNVIVYKAFSYDFIMNMKFIKKY